MAERTQLWVDWLKKSPEIEAAFYEDLAEIERLAVNHALRSSSPPTTEMYEARGAVKVVDQLRNKMTMYEREAQSNAHRAATRKTR